MKKLAAGVIALSTALAAAFGAANDGAAVIGSQIPANAVLPQWTAPKVPVRSAGAPTVSSEDLEIVHSRDSFGGWVARVAGRTMAVGQERLNIGWLGGGELRWLDLANAPGWKYAVRGRRNVIETTISAKDGDGARWEIRQRFTPGAVPGAIDIRTEIRVNQDRLVAFLPAMMVFPGVGNFGAHKDQGLFAGLEYLENEPSSSEADVIGPASKRQVPDSLKITFPLMGVADGGDFVALTWETQPQICAVFDSPDRMFESGGHAMGLLFPGSNGKNRQEGNLLPHAAELLRANEPLVIKATLFGGKGNSMVPAVQRYVAMRGLPPLPDIGMDLHGYAALAAGGWLDSQIREGDLFRHALGGNFHPGRAVDAAVWMDWLAGQTARPELARRLEDQASAVVAPVAPQDLNSALIGHVRDPVEALAFGHVAENAARAGEAGHQMLLGFEADGSVHYHAPAGGVDLAKTHYTNEANGLTAASVLELLKAAAFSGKPELLEAAVNRLRDMDKFKDGVPRGAQTWECPLHTPDILAAAHLVRAYTLGYELTGDADFLNQARYWAWTGVPFVYLVNPTTNAIGLYGTIAVYGATQWRAPVWLGLPVQWCGLVYADAIYRLAHDDPDGPWRKLADGITLSGIAQSWPTSDAVRQGLLPDSFVLRSQNRNAPPINPGTVQACAMQLFNRPVYGFHCFRENGLRVHAAGEIQNAKEEKGRVGFDVQSWLPHPGYVFINGLAAKPDVRLNGKEPDLSGANQFLEKEGWLILEVNGKAHVTIALTSPSAKQNP